MEIYYEARKLVTLLEKRELHSISQEISDVIDCSSIGTEILMKLRKCLNSLLSDNICENDKEKKLVKEILREIEIIL